MFSLRTSAIVLSFVALSQASKTSIFQKRQISTQTDIPSQCTDTCTPLFTDTQVCLSQSNESTSGPQYLACICAADFQAVYQTCINCCLTAQNNWFEATGETDYRSSCDALSSSSSFSSTSSSSSAARSSSTAAPVVSSSSRPASSSVVASSSARTNSSSVASSVKPSSASGSAPASSASASAKSGAGAVKVSGGLAAVALGVVALF
ncbi:hypothetical protein T439DRAFT_325561 [Meredithblackwellia eburnea MCA 4105]